MIILANSAKVFTGTMNWLIIGLTMSANWEIFQCVNYKYITKDSLNWIFDKWGKLSKLLCTSKTSIWTTSHDITWHHMTSHDITWLHHMTSRLTWAGRTSLRSWGPHRWARRRLCRCQWRCWGWWSSAQWRRWCLSCEFVSFVKLSVTQMVRRSVRLVNCSLLI